MEKLKESKIKLIDEEIAYLIEKKDDYSIEINEIATFISLYDENMELGRLDIASINEKRYMMKAIYDLIDDLENIKKNIKKMED